METPNNTSPGWYTDPEDPLKQRYWDGILWTSETRVASQGAGVPSQGNTPLDSPPKNYLIWAIITTMLCCWPLGIPSVIYAIKVNSLWAQGKKQEALEASAKAKKFAIGATTIVVVLALGYIVLLVTGFTLNA